MPFYVSQFIAGAFADKPGLVSVPVGDQPGRELVDLRPDGGATISGGGLNACLLYLPFDVADVRLLKLADVPEENLSSLTIGALNGRLGTALPETGTPCSQILQALLLSPPSGRWRPARAGRFQPELILSLGSFQVRLPTGRSGIDPALATDNFDRADANDLGVNWTEITGDPGFNISANRAVPDSLGADHGERYSALTWPDDQYAQVVLAALDGTGAETGGGPALRVATDGANTLYRFPASASTTVGATYAKIVAGLYTLIAQRDADFVVGDTFYAEIQGTQAVIKKNGVQIGAALPTDGGITAGAAGIAYSSTMTDLDLDDWEGGDFAAAVGAAQFMAAARQGALTAGITGRQYV